MDDAKPIIPAHYIKPRCDGILTPQAMEYKKGTLAILDVRCHNQASIKISGKCMCKKHAAMEALNILLRNGEAQS